MICKLVNDIRYIGVLFFAPLNYFKHTRKRPRYSTQLITIPPSDDILFPPSDTYSLQVISFLRFFSPDFPPRYSRPIRISWENLVKKSMFAQRVPAIQVIQTSAATV